MDFKITFPLAKNISDGTNHTTKSSLSEDAKKSVTKASVGSGEVYRPDLTVFDHRTKSYVPQYSNIYIEGIASGVVMDLDGERMMEEALVSMAESFTKSSEDLPLREVHNIEYNGINGAILDIFLTKDEYGISSLGYKAVLNNPDVDPTSAKLLYSLESGIILGVSVGGVINKAEEISPGSKRYNFFDVELTEVSTTQFPAYALSTLKFSETLKKAKKQFNPEVMEKTKEEEIVVKTEDKATETNVVKTEDEKTPTEEEKIEEVKKSEEAVSAEEDKEEVVKTEDAKDGNEEKEEVIKTEGDDEKEVTKEDEQKEVTKKTEEKTEDSEPLDQVEKSDNQDNGDADKTVEKGAVKENIGGYKTENIQFQMMYDILHGAEYATWDGNTTFAEIRDEVASLILSIPDDFSEIEGLKDIYKTLKLLKSKTESIEGVAKSKKEDADVEKSTNVEKTIEKLQEEIEVLKSSPEARVSAVFTDNSEEPEEKLYQGVFKTFEEAKESVLKQSSNPTMQSALIKKAERFFNK